TPAAPTTSTRSPPVTRMLASRTSGAPPRGWSRRTSTSSIPGRFVMIGSRPTPADPAWQKNGAARAAMPRIPYHPRMRRRCARALGITLAGIIAALGAALGPGCRFDTDERLDRAAARLDQLERRLAAMERRGAVDTQAVAAELLGKGQAAGLS